MSVRIQFDKPNAWFTNLDFVSGRVILTLQSDATLQAISVKLEGESKTRLGVPKADNDRKSRTEIEVHKLLYKVVTVFPSAELQKLSTNNSSYTLLAGQYEYPFRIKLPFNNSCSSSGAALKDLKVGGISVQFAPDTNKHVKRALPPTLAAFPGEAEIRYYVKATVVRPKFYQENLRYQVDIKFLPIEPPRPPNLHQEKFARRKQQFKTSHTIPQKKGLFRKPSAQEPWTTEEPPNLQVDARLPEPAILTCNEPLPLRILVQKLNESSAALYLSMLQIELIVHTHIRAHDLNRVETSSLIITSQANMAVQIGGPETCTDFEVPSRFWDNITLPSVIAPSFETCNISRTYELEIRVGFRHGGPGDMRPEILVLPLRLPVKIYSGIKPPPALLRAIATSLPQNFSQPIPYVSPTPHSPSSPSAPSYVQHGPQTGMLGPPQGPLPEDAAPPSYEDAMAEDIGPVDGPRRDFTSPIEAHRTNSGGSVGGLNDDTKRPGLARHPSERLFPQNGIPNHPRAVSFGATSPMDGQIPTSPTYEDAPSFPPRPLEPTDAIMGSVKESERRNT